MLTTTGTLLESTRAVGAFNVITLEYAEGIADAAERSGLPAVLAISHNAVRFHGALAPLASACRQVAERASVPIALHLDHCEDAVLVAEAIDLGFGSVMFDAATLPYDENLELTAHVAELAHRHGVWIEAELGEIGGKDGAHAPGVRTDPGEAADFVAATGVDALAVAVGTSHAMTERTGRTDTDLIARLSGAVPVPLVLHGSSGLPDDAVTEAVHAGIRKVNVGTQLSIAYSDAMRTGLAEGRADPRAALAAARAAVAGSVERLLAAIAA